MRFSSPSAIDKDVLVTEVEDDLVLTLETSGRGTVLGGGIKDRDNTPFTIMAVPDPDETFKNWTGTSAAALADAELASTTIDVTADAQVTANFSGDGGIFFGGGGGGGGGGCRQSGRPASLWLPLLLLGGIGLYACGRRRAAGR